MSSRIIFTKDAPQPIGPYSQAVECGNLLFISGQIPIDPLSGQIVATSIQDQSRQVIANLKAILNFTGLSTKQIVKTTVYLRNIVLFSDFNLVYEEEMEGARPARSVVEVSGLPKNALVEIEAVACR
jgi:2-iminobutanoate/2-iminopropanoate deaminase